MADRKRPANRPAGNGRRNGRLKIDDRERPTEDGQKKMDEKKSRCKQTGRREGQVAGHLTNNGWGVSKNVFKRFYHASVCGKKTFFKRFS